MLRLAIAQLKPSKGAYRHNLSRLGEVFVTLAGEPEPPDLLILPETALTGYFVEGAVRELALSADAFYADLAALHAESGAPPLDIVVGSSSCGGPGCTTPPWWRRWAAPTRGSGTSTARCFCPPMASSTRSASSSPAARSGPSTPAGAGRR